MNELFFNSNNQEQTISSREIAELTGKRHSDVLEAIRKMEEAWVKVNGRKFSLVEYKDAKGEMRPEYQLNKTECLYVGTKFNDEARAKLVIRWKELEEVNVQSLTLEELTLKQSLALYNQSKQLKQLEREVTHIKAQITTRNEDYFTIAGYGTLINEHIDLIKASVLGRKATKMCKESNIATGEVYDPRFGKVKTYPTNVLREIFNRKS